MNNPESRHFLDSAYARLVALGCFALSVAALAYVHREDLFPPAPEPVAAKDDAFTRCFREAVASIDKMLAEKTIGADKHRLFRMRAEARCRARTGDAGPPPAGLPQAR